MKLVRFEHNRCGEFDCAEYMLAPDGMDKRTLSALADQVSNEMVADAKKLKGVGDDEYADAPPNVWHPEYDKYPDKTVAEVKAIHAEQRAERKMWENEHREWKRPFQARMCEHGLRPLWDTEDDEIQSVWVDWGHAHSLDLQYGSHVKGVDDL